MVSKSIYLEEIRVQNPNIQVDSVNFVWDKIKDLSKEEFDQLVEHEERPTDMDICHCPHCQYLDETKDAFVKVSGNWYKVTRWFPEPEGKFEVEVFGVVDSYDIEKCWDSLEAGLVSDKFMADHLAAIEAKKVAELDPNYVKTETDLLFEKYIKQAELQEKNV